MTEQTKSTIAVFVEPTPNPNSLKFVVGRQIVSAGPYEFAKAADAAQSKLAQTLFAIAGVEGVFVGSNFVTVRKDEEASWEQIEPKALSAIEEGVSSGEPVVIEPESASGGAAKGASTQEVVIRQILDEEIRPAVASDGGDVQFESYNEGVLKLKLVGACSGCPSSLMTLKMGIERRLREDIPELVEVIQS
jgi:Fe-S cluster biogenesis protein NfuA